MGLRAVERGFYYSSIKDSRKQPRTVDAVMQKFIDKRAITKDGHVAEAIKEAYIVTETKNILA